MTQKLIAMANEQELIDACTSIYSDPSFFNLLGDEKGKFVVLRSLEALQDTWASQPAWCEKASQAANEIARQYMNGQGKLFYAAGNHFGTK